MHSECIGHSNRIQSLLVLHGIDLKVSKHFPKYLERARPLDGSALGSELKELDAVVLTRDIPEHGLVVGDVGGIVMVHGDGEGFEVEFGTLDGETIAVATLDPGDIRPIYRRESAHVRQLAGIQTS